MAWLSSGGTAFSYRMVLPCANPSTQGNRVIDGVPFPAWFLLSLGKVAQAGFEDVHVTTSDGTTELACSLNAAKTALNIDYPTMPVGRTTLYVYYGHASCAAPTAPSLPRTYAETGGTLVDNGFESGVEHASLDADADWVKVGTPAVEQYDVVVGAPQGSQVAHIQADATANIYEGVKETTSAGMTGTATEIRFWVYTDYNNKYRLIRDTDDQAQTTWNVRLNASGGIDRMDASQVWQATGQSYSGATWYQFKVVANFTAKTWSAYYRTTATGAWTTIGTGYAFTNNTKTSSQGSFFSVYDASAHLWFDAVQYSATGITDAVPTSAVVHVGEARYETASEGDTGRVAYIWGAQNLETATLDSANATTAYLNAATQLCGVTDAGRKCHLLLKPFEGALLKGTVSEAALYLYAENAPGGNATQYLHRLRNVGTDGIEAWPTGTIATGWGTQAGGNTPCWNNRLSNYQANDNGLTKVAWQTAGATGANEIAAATHTDLALAAGGAAGYKEVALLAADVQDWQGDAYSQGVLLKDSTDSSGDRMVTYTGPAGANPPVLVVTYSALDALQLSARKVTTRTYCYPTFATQDRYVQIPTANGFAVMAWVTCDQQIALAYITPEGYIYRVQVSAGVYQTAPAATALHNTSPCFGLFYDAGERRYYLAGSEITTGQLVIAWSDVDVPVGWTWNDTNDKNAAKSIISPRSGSDNALYYDSEAGRDAIYGRTFTRSTNSWGTETKLINGPKGGTQPTLSSGIDASVTTIPLSATTVLPAVGPVKIDTEYIWYTGKTADSITGCTRGAFGSSAASHSSAATVNFDTATPTYLMIAEDPTNSCYHVVYTEGSTSASPNWAYTRPCYFRKYYADSDGTIKDEAGSTLSLPVDQRNARPVGGASRSAYPEYAVGLICLDNGDVLVACDAMTDPTKTRAENYTALKVYRLPTGSSTWARVDIATSIREVGFVDLGDGNVAMTGLDSTSDTVLKSMSGDHGQTWSDPIAVATHSLPAKFGDTVGLWMCSASESRNLDGKGIVYASHMAYFGAVYIDAVQLPASYEGSASTPCTGAVSCEGTGGMQGSAATACQAAAAASGARGATGSATTPCATGAAAAGVWGVLGSAVTNSVLAAFARGVLGAIGSAVTDAVAGATASGESAHGVPGRAYGLKLSAGDSSATLGVGEEPTELRLEVIEP